MFEIESFYDALLMLKDNIYNIYSWFITPVAIPFLDEVSFTPVALMFGSGLILVLGVVIVKAFL